MKKLIGLFLVLTMGEAFAAQIPQQFYRAQKGENLVQAGWDFITGSYKAKSSTKNVDFSNTNFPVTYMYGLTEDMALGLTLVQESSYGVDALGDYELFVLGQHQDFYYGLSYFLSEKRTVDSDGNEVSQKSGGNHFKILLGYAFTENVGAKLEYTPKYEFKLEDDDSTNEKGANTTLTAYYEHMMGDHVLGGQVSSLSVGAAESFGSDDKAYTSMMLRGYAALKYGDLTFLPALAYIVSNDLYDEFSATNLEVKARYEF